MRKIAIVGGSGYTGVELLRVLACHPGTEVIAITSRAEAGRQVADTYPSLRKIYNLNFSAPTLSLLSQADLVFFATPNGVAMNMVPELLKKGVRVIDLAADFRFQSVSVWSQWYGMTHACPQLLSEAVYGLPEINREAIRHARLVANPGCYPTAVQLGFLPLIEQGIVLQDQLIADCKSGVSGAGRGSAVGSLFCEAGESLKAYGVNGHRHLPEIEERLAVAAESAVSLTFIPHLAPMIRGIYATLYGVVSPEKFHTFSLEQLQEDYIARYANHPFVDVMPLGSYPETRSVKGSNICRIALHQPQSGNKIVVLSVIDNLVKGAAGQAIQNMNLMLGFAEQTGLEQTALMP